MNIQRPLFWHQGLFLQPHHFQLQDLTSQALMGPLLDFLTPYFWGISELEIHRAALGNKSFHPLKGGFLFPDGAYAEFPGNAIIEPRSYDEAWVEGGRPFTIFAGLRKLNMNKENVTALRSLDNISEVTTRFVTTLEPEEVADLHQGGPSAKIGRLHYALKIFFETEKDQIGDYELIPVAQLERFGEEIRLCDRFVPPTLFLNNHEVLNRIVKEIRDQISSRSRQLEELKLQRGIHTAEFGSRDMVYLLALRSLNRYVPPLLQFTEVRQVHPWVCYGLLRQLIGELSTFSNRVNVRGELEDGTPLLPVYDHWNIWECFSAAQALITELLDEITAGPEYIIRLVFDGTYYAAELPPAIFEGRNRFFLVFRTEGDPKFVLNSLASVIKISSREQLPILIARALPGLRLEHLPVPPQELPRRAHSIYFQIDHHGNHWGEVEKGLNMGMYWDTAPEDLEVELMVVGRS